jgi:hypothetical protein
MELLAETPVKTLASVASNQTAKIAIVGAGELPGKVRIFSVASILQRNSARFAFIGSDPKLRVGAFGRATIDVGRTLRPSRFRVQLFYTGPGGAVVQVVRDNRIETRRVTVACSPLDKRRFGMASPKARWWSRVPGPSFGKDIAFRSITAGEPSARQ